MEIVVKNEFILLLIIQKYLIEICISVWTFPISVHTSSTHYITINFFIQLEKTYGIYS